MKTFEFFFNDGPLVSDLENDTLHLHFILACSSFEF